MDKSRTPEDTRLILDVMLGSLARHLRMCGYDTAYALDRGIEDDNILYELAADEDRVLVTRDIQLAERTPKAICLDARNVDEQLQELRDAGFVLSLDKPTRCSRCNGRLEQVDADTTTPEYAPDSSDERVWRCAACGQHYWKGSHWDDVEKRLSG